MHAKVYFNQGKQKTAKQRQNEIVSSQINHNIFQVIKNPKFLLKKHYFEVNVKKHSISKDKGHSQMTSHNFLTTFFYYHTF